MCVLAITTRLIAIIARNCGDPRLLAELRRTLVMCGDDVDDVEALLCWKE